MCHFFPPICFGLLQRDCRAAPPCGAYLRLAAFGRAPLTKADPDDAAQIDDQEHEGEQKDKVDQELRDEL